ncbi:MAG: tetratricopeptide repeat protein [Phycisphaeraceae bacterium]|nr:tetratricopeptide repeat protein [Phycisphaeraceae bacterium]
MILLSLSVTAQAQDDPAHQQFLFAYKLLQRGDDDLAAEAFDSYLGKFPDAPKRGDAMYYRALLYRRAGDDMRAAQMLTAAPAPAIVPRYAVDLLLGQVLADQQQFDKAIAALERIDAGKLNPAVRASVHYLRGLAYRGADNLPGARQELSAASDLDSDLKGRALLDLARVQVLIGEKDAAIATLVRSFNLPDAAAVAESARLAGDLSYQQQQYEQAVTFYQRVAESYQSSRHFGPAVLGMLWSHLATGRYHSVLEVFEQYRTALPIQDRPTAWYLAGSAQQELGDHQQAIALFDQIAHGEGDYPLLETTLYKLATSYFHAGNDAEMRKTLDRLDKQFPESPLKVDAAYLLATADARKGDVAHGAARLTAIIEQGTDNPYYAQALLRRARLYEQNNQIDAAIRDYQSYLASTTAAEAAAGALRLIDLTYRTEQFDLSASTAEQLLAQADKLGPQMRQEAMYRLALAKIKIDDSDAALKLLDLLQHDFPLNAFAAEADYYRAVLLMSRQQGETALPLLLEAGGSSRLSVVQRANALRLAAMQQQSSKHPDAAMDTLTDLEALIGRDKLTDDELLWMAQHTLDNSDLEAAVAYAMLPGHDRPGVPAATRAEALYITGKAQRKLKQFDKAIESFEAALALGSGFDERAQLELARTRRDRGDREAALADLSALTNSETSIIAAEAIFDSAQIQRDIARDRRRQEDDAGRQQSNEEARRLFKRLVLLYPFPELSPLPELSYLELAELAIEQNRVDEATGELNELAEKFPDGPYAVYARAVIAADRRMLGDALAMIEPLKDKPLDPRLKLRVDALRQLLEARK